MCLRAAGRTLGSHCAPCAPTRTGASGGTCQTASQSCLRGGLRGLQAGEGTKPTFQQKAFCIWNVLTPQPSRRGARTLTLSYFLSLPSRRSCWHLHPHVADDIPSDRRFQKGSQDLERMQEGVRLVIMIPTPVATAEEESRRVSPGDTPGEARRGQGEPRRHWGGNRGPRAIGVRRAGVQPKTALSDPSQDHCYNSNRRCVSPEMKKPVAPGSSFGL